MKRIRKTAAAFFAVMSVVFTCFPYRASAYAKEISVIQQYAESVTLNAACDSLSAAELSAVMDGNYYSYCYVTNDTRLHFTAPSPVKSLYFMFEAPCSWTVSLPDGSVKQGGENGFLHEFVALDSGVTGFDMDIPAGSSLTDVYAFSEGQVPDWVQIWEPPCKRADLMILPTHADDEHLWFGGAMPYYAGELGYDVQVVYLTDHKKDPHRRHELLNGLWTVGVKNYPVLTDKFTDDIKTKWSLAAAENAFGRDRVTEFQVEMLRRFAPRVILAHDINGEYGHGAHRLNAATLLDALKIYEDPSVYPESYGKYGAKKVQKCYLHLWEENQIVVQWSDKILGRFDGKNSFEVAVEGYHCHKSQLRWKNYLLEWGKYDCRKFGLAYTTVGYDTPGLNDLFEHVDMADDEPDGEADGKSDVVTPQENPESVNPVSEPLAENGADRLSDLLESKVNVTLFGKNLSMGDAAFAILAAVVSLAAIVIVICLKRRE